MKVCRFLFCLICSFISIACNGSSNPREDYLVAGRFESISETTSGKCSSVDRELLATFKVLKPLHGDFKEEVQFIVCDHDGTNPFSYMDYENGNETLVADWLLYLRKNKDGFVATKFAELLTTKDGHLAICPWNLKQFKSEAVNLVDMNFSEDYSKDLTNRSEVIVSLFKEHKCYSVSDSKAQRVKGINIETIKP